MKRLFLLGLQLVLWVAGSWAAAPEQQFIDVDGEQRTFLLHVPSSADLSKPVATVMVLHGAMMNGSMVRSMSGMDEMADEKGFIAVYPDGTGTGAFKSWNAGGVAKAMAKTADDSRFISLLIDKLIAENGANPDRIFITGISNGGMMCYRLACELDGKIAAIAPIAGTLAVEDCQPRMPIPIIHFHGTDDNFVPYGGPNEKTPKFFTFKSVDETLAFWREKNRCDSEGAAETLPDTVDDGTTVERITYKPMEGGAPIVHLKIMGGGHAWPGRKGMEGIIGKSSMDISANRLLWDFFEHNPRRMGDTAMSKPERTAEFGAVALFDFGKEAMGWRTVDDVVMGGVSSSTIRIENGIGIFSGHLSLENNGGFTSVRSNPKALGLKQGDSVIARLKGDGREFSLNLYVPNQRTAFSYRAKFTTKKGEWQEIEVPLEKFVATSFGQEMPEMGPLNPEDVVSVGFLLGDKKEGAFRLEIEWIRVKS